MAFSLPNLIFINSFLGKTISARHSILLFIKNNSRRMSDYDDATLKYITLIDLEKYQRLDKNFN